MDRGLHIFPVPHIPEIEPGDDLAAVIFEAMQHSAINPEDGDIFVIAQKAVSKAEGCVYRRDEIEVSPFARQMSTYTGHEPEYMELVLQNSRRVVRMAQGFVISQTHQGLVMANAGVDASNAGSHYNFIVLPPDPDKSALILRQKLEGMTHKRLAVIISDTFGRPWRTGQVNVAIGLSGLKPLLDYRGLLDNNGREMKATEIAVADEIASAAELISGKTRKLPVVIVRGYEYEPGDGSVQELVRDESLDLFK